MNTNEKLIQDLAKFNAWRRGNDEPMPHPADIGVMIDDAIAALSAHTQEQPAKVGQVERQAVPDGYVLVSVKSLQKFLDLAERNWHQIDSEWGPTEGGIDQDIKDGRCPEIAEMRAMIAAAHQKHKGGIKW